MFNKVAKFKMLPPGRSAPGMSAPVNDNCRNARPCAPQRGRTPRLVCRWSLSPSTGRPVCRWELDNTNEPNPGLSDASRHGRAIHKTVFQLSYQEEAVRIASAVAGDVQAANAPPLHSRKVLHARH